MNISVASVKKQQPDPCDSQEYCATREGKWVCAVKDYVRHLEYGEVTIRVHGGKVVQVHKTEKIQFS